MSSDPGRQPYLTGQAWYASASGVETVLFVGVQVVMVMCLVLVAAQALAA